MNVQMKKAACIALAAMVALSTAQPVLAEPDTHIRYPQVYRDVEARDLSNDMDYITLWAVNTAYSTHSGRHYNNTFYGSWPPCTATKNTFINE